MPAKKKVVKKKLKRAGTECDLDTICAWLGKVAPSGPIPGNFAKRGEPWLVMVWEILKDMENRLHNAQKDIFQIKFQLAGNTGTAGFGPGKTPPPPPPEFP
jgi:hypothetical protein